MFRFTIRDVLWLTVVVALALGWWLERRSLRMRLRAVQLREQKAQQELLVLKIDKLEWEEARRYRDARDRQSWDVSKASRENWERHSPTHDTPLQTPHPADPARGLAAAGGGGVVGVFRMAG